MTPVPQRANDVNIGVLAAHHLLGMRSDGERFVRIAVQRNNRRLVDHDILSFDVNQGIGRTQIDANVIGQQSGKK